MEDSGIGHINKKDQSEIADLNGDRIRMDERFQPHVEELLRSGGYTILDLHMNELRHSVNSKRPEDAEVGINNIGSDMDTLVKVPGLIDVSLEEIGALMQDGALTLEDQQVNHSQIAIKPDQLVIEGSMNKDAHDHTSILDNMAGEFNIRGAKLINPNVGTWVAIYKFYKDKYSDSLIPRDTFLRTSNPSIRIGRFEDEEILTIADGSGAYDWLGIGAVIIPDKT